MLAGDGSGAVYVLMDADSIESAWWATMGGLAELLEEELLLSWRLIPWSLSWREKNWG